MKEYNITVRTDGIEMLGAMLSLHDEVRLRHAQHAVTKHSRFLHAAHPDMPVQCALLLLRWCPYLARVLLPRVGHDAFAHFDAQIQNAVAAKADLPNPFTKPSARTLITTPLRHGGLGFIPHTRTSSMAYWSATAATIHTMNAHGDDPNMLFTDSPSLHHIRHAHDTITAFGVNPHDPKIRNVFPDNMDECWSLYSDTLPRKLQHTLTNVAHEHMRTALRLDVGQVDEELQESEPVQVEVELLGGVGRDL